MTQEALKLALEALGSTWTDVGTKQYEIEEEAITAIKEALAQPEYQSTADKSKLEKVPAKGTLLAQPEQEPVAWPCLIAEADFSENTVILAMQCTDYKVSAGNHWLSNTPPQRTWVGMTKEQLATTGWSADFRAGALWAEAKLKERNS